MKTNQKKFNEEIQILKEQLKLEEIYILGLLKGFSRNDLKAMMKDMPIMPVF